MKKIFLSLMLLMSLLVSCEMDYKPYGSLDETTAIQSMNDLYRFRNGVYTGLRGMTSGSWVTLGDIQTDQFYGLINNANRNGIISNGVFNSSTEEFEGFFGSCYGQIAKANYLISKTDAFLTSPEFADSAIVIGRYRAEGHFLRAFAYFFLADHYCQSYTQCNPEAKASGMPIVTKYEPTGDVNRFPSRNTLKETFDLIESDLAKAFDGLKAFEEVNPSAIVPCAKYLSSYAVAAMQARVALVKGDYATALSKAEFVIESNKYPLATINAYAKLWTTDEGTEIIFRPHMSKTEGLSSTGSAYTASTKQEEADYIPTLPTLELYEEGDVRFDAFFKVWRLNISGATVPAFIFLKYPGNEALRTTSENNYCNMPKAFRTSELYLIAAEAAVMTDDMNKATKYLNDLRRNRISSYTDEVYSKNVLMPMVKIERQRELLGEGFRMSDLRRWNEGFDRSQGMFGADFGDLDSYVVKAGTQVKYNVGDYRLTWPIPTTEMDSNPSLKGQQNPGY